MSRSPDAAPTAAMPALLALTPMAVEAAAARAARVGPGGGTGSVQVIRTGAGPRRAAAAADRVAARPGRAVAVLGVGGALVDDLAPGDVVVADAVLGPDDGGGDLDGAVPARQLPTAPQVAAALRSHGLRVRVGAIVSSPRLITGSDRKREAARGALLADTESWWLAASAAGRPLAVVRVVVDTPGRELMNLRTVPAGLRALDGLRRALPALVSWAETAEGPRKVVLAGPRASCAGVERAVEIVERALARYGPPIYVRRQIVHNAHVVSRLEAAGAVFVQEVEEVPAGATLVLSAHGVAPAVRSSAADRAGVLIDATCPLVAKVHAEARRFSRQGRQVLLIGHAGHEEVEGTVGEVPGTMVLGSVDDVDRLGWATDTPIALLNQTTLSPDDVAEVAAAVRRRFPLTTEPAAADVCYATQNRQEAVRAVAKECDVVLVIGSANSSNGNRLIEVARRAGAAAHLVEDDSALDPTWLVGARSVGLSAAASTPEVLVRRMVDALAALGPVEVSELRVIDENVRFQLPAEVR